MRLPVYLKYKDGTPVMCPTCGRQVQIGNDVGGFIFKVCEHLKEQIEEHIFFAVGEGRE